MFNFPPINHFTFCSVKFHSKTLSHFFFHKKFSACSAQNCSGFSTARLYSDWYCSKEVMRFMTEANLQIALNDLLLLSIFYCESNHYTFSFANCCLFSRPGEDIWTNKEL